MSAFTIVDVEAIGVGPRHNVLAITTRTALELVENAVVFVQVAKLPSQVLMCRDHHHRFRLHADVPHLHTGSVSRPAQPS